MATNTAGSVARQYASQLVHYLRFTVNYNDAGIGSGVRKGTLPAGALILSTSVNVATVFNAASTNVLTVGTNSTSFNNIVASGDVDESAAALTNGIKPTSAALVPLASDLDVYAMYTQTGTAATTGKAYVVIQYIPDNDG
ncbi:unknown protein [Azorhizobium caulinodans ORS 571]|uniref:Uncharacterized protein n=1 Tax=Azorhizobium caulinodans (strain ATCC 43989 / DSM 5975 / JCM 20966 / LMG 6465 / NBRC 14845 / NCIMB 13405 / ORS 571) TaxID=438753 RepID=A8HTJ8_AZOC5|nr:hypothetical protein [Azorhizobium caulinodans]BAF86842.1 unknown protein [Azorhizobium caulinodans ORS 571]